jgi:hypothetical protein
VHPTLTAALVTVVSLAFVASSCAAPLSSAAVVLEDSLPSFSLAANPLVSAAPAAPFAFVANFEDQKLDGFSSVGGAVPTVETAVNYAGEPSLRSSASGGTQVDVASTGFVRGEGSLSFEVAIDAGTTAKGYFGLATGAPAFVAVVGVQAGEVVAGPNLTHLKSIEPVPTGTAQPAGWVDLVADVDLNASSPHMQVFVDRTDVVAASVKTPGVADYTQAEIDTTHGAVRYTNVYVTTYELATYLPGYNNMEGYGQGSALLVKELPEFENYTATMTLHSWSEPQGGILSFQINAMNRTGTTKSTCHGFFQLGVSLDKNGKITPWYVPGVDCESTNFVAATSTPPNSTLVLSIVWDQAAQEISFVIDDVTLGVTWSHVLLYTHGGFYGAYTQMEFQPCCNTSSIGSYALDGELSDMTITTVHGVTQLLPASYMLPFQLDAAPSWFLGYYAGSTGGYAETSG